MNSNNAPGETRTPNLLIRSQFRGWCWGQVTAVLRVAGSLVSATDRTESATGSHNNSHNNPEKRIDPAHVLDRTPLKLLVCVKGWF